MASIYDSVECDLESFQNRYIMAPELWEKFNLHEINNVDFSQWKSMKLMNDTGDKFSELLKDIPSECGGIYVYTINPGIIPTCGSYIMYIGMASKTPTEDLRKRVRSYQSELGPNYRREKLHRLFAKWGKYIYVHYLPICMDRKTIFEVETRLIAAIIPPCNPDIRAKAVKRAVKAFV